MTAEAFHPLPFVASSLPGGTTGLDNPGPAAEHVHALCAVAAVPESVTALRTFARALARRWLLPEDVEDALCLVVTELVTNVVLHSMSPQVTMYLAKGRAGCYRRGPGQRPVGDSHRSRHSRSRRLRTLRTRLATGRRLRHGVDESQHRRGHQGHCPFRRLSCRRAAENATDGAATSHPSGWARVRASRTTRTPWTRVSTQGGAQPLFLRSAGQGDRAPGFHFTGPDLWGRQLGVPGGEGRPRSRARPSVWWRERGAAHPGTGRRCGGRQPVGHHPQVVTHGRGQARIWNE